MTSKEAEETLGLIRALMERSTRYTNLSGHAGIAAGVSTLVGCALRLWFNTPFLSTWIGVLIAAAGASLYFTAALARANGEAPWTACAGTDDGRDGDGRTGTRHPRARPSGDPVAGGGHGVARLEGAEGAPPDAGRPPVRVPAQAGG